MKNVIIFYNACGWMSACGLSVSRSLSLNTHASDHKQTTSTKPHFQRAFHNCRRSGWRGEGRANQGSPVSMFGVLCCHSAGCGSLALVARRPTNQPAAAYGLRVIACGFLDYGLWLVGHWLVSEWVGGWPIGGLVWCLMDWLYGDWVVRLTGMLTDR